MTLKCLFLNVLFVGIVTSPNLFAINNSGIKNSKVVEIYILAGQSNAVGYNNMHTFYPAPFPNSFQKQKKVMFWPGSNSIDSLKNVWTALQIGTSVVGENAFDPEIAFGNKLATTYAETEIAIIKYAVGGTGIARSKDYTNYISGFEDFDDNGNNWHPPINEKSAGKLYNNLLQNIDNVLAALECKAKCSAV